MEYDPETEKKIDEICLRYGLAIGESKEYVRSALNILLEGGFNKNNSLSEVEATFKKLSQKGIEGSKAGAQLRNLFLRGTK